MAGIWERIETNAVNRLSVHLLEAMFVAYAGGFASRAQIVAAADAQSGQALDAAETADLDQIADVFDGFGSTNTERIARLEYLERMKYAVVAAELGAISESKFRADLGIT